MSDITILEDCFGEWVAIYIGDVLFAEGHSLNYVTILKHLEGKRIGTVNRFEVDFEEDGLASRSFETITECCKEGLIKDINFILKISTCNIIEETTRNHASTYNPPRTTA